MALSFLRAPHPPKLHQADKDLTIYENNTSSVQYHSKGSKYMMTHTIPPTDPKEGPSIIQPPFHYHIYQVNHNIPLLLTYKPLTPYVSQTEHFQVISGTAHLFFGLDTKPTLILSSNPGSKTSATLGPKRYHRFENASKTDPLAINIQLDPEDYENEQRFFRNFFG
ncbi:uncharacterized protein MYCFIDRAFT_210523 [Pseudocercospora fijiensis CIRAD86]|uniref:Cupin 2 conserved barrel domain-containing protein n=1 Tax=Pseudocercospora fijiensis (strain CIRAD86) TaxID=383855 RepID=M3API9_PSEFD|nr:uncharacterized protein MYCFIDRAFT_210523 [Pseudocercospora fijiensis CIRAD86]EME86531.1 hypothetical protein MYCFIDRAFT_210523 [Pseudocercospora fijiensis CIRAD86]